MPRRVFEVWCARRGIPPNVVNTFGSREAAERSCEYTHEVLNEFADPLNPWRVWVENKRGTGRDSNPRIQRGAASQSDTSELHAGLRSGGADAESDQ